MNYDRARKQRRYLERSRKDVAAAIGVDESTLWRWETGERQPRSVDLLEAWAREIELDPAELLGEPKRVAG